MPALNKIPFPCLAVSVEKETLSIEKEEKNREIKRENKGKIGLK